jgi:hypothetical protein
LTFEERVVYAENRKKVEAELEKRQIEEVYRQLGIALQKRILERKTLVSN